MTKNHFPMLADALSEVREYLFEMGATLKDEQSFFGHYEFGGVQYGQTKTRLGELATYKGKTIEGRMAKRAISLSIYRMESGTYEAVAYIN